MKEIIKSKYARLFLAGLALDIICAWFSTGFYHADEHFQILEFCNYKMGFSPVASLAWEFQYKMRAALLPGIAYTFARIMDWWGLYNPFILAFILRLLAAICSWYVTCKFCLLLLPKFKTATGERLFIMMSLFLWFIPYLSVRFTAENMSGIALLFGVYSILSLQEEQEGTSISATSSNSLPLIKYLIAGAMFGIALFIRFQISFAIIGFGAWLIFIKKTRWKYVLILITGAIAAIGLNMVTDFWFYGIWTFTPYNYFHANIILNRAAEFGTSPWWFYFSDFLMRAFPPLSIILLGLFFAGVYKNLKDPLVWIIIPFFVSHCCIGHKELRFLFPVTFIFVYISALGLDYLLTRNYYQRIHKYVYRISVILCIPVLIYRTFVPSNFTVNYFSYIYNNYNHNNTVLFFLHDDFDYSMYGLRENFYRNPLLKTVDVDSIGQMNNYLQTYKPVSALFVSRKPLVCKDSNSSGREGGWNFKGYKTEMVYCYLPAWILKYDINNWEERTEIWSIYKFTKINQL